MIKANKNNENKPDFDEMMNEVEEDFQEKDAEQDIINRIPELKKLNENIEQATNTCVNATLQCESVIQQYQRAEGKLDDSVTTISGKVDTINEHIDQIMEDAPKKLQLKVSVKLNDDDWQKIQELFDQERKWIIGKMQEHIHEVNTMFVEERMKAMNRCKPEFGISSPYLLFLT